MDQALKQRLVGATVLIILAVIILPMLLSGQPALQNESRRIEVPDEPPELSVETRRFPIGDQDGSSPSTVPEPRVETPAPERGEEMLAGDDRPDPEREAPTADPEPVAEIAETPPAESEATPGRYLVQVASFSNPANANQLSELLRDNQLPVVMDTVETAAGLLYRVRVGPQDELQSANQALEQIRALMSDLNPRVVDLRPEENAPVTDPSDPMIRWVVQAGSFSDRANADELVIQLKTAGFAAYLETVRGADGVAHKVKLGPFIERQSAVDERGRLQRNANIDGLVMSED